jgi:dephospho-CoA kinase
MKVIVIGGYPGVGKSTIVNRVLEDLSSQGRNFILNKHDKLVTYMADQTGLIVMGTYGKGETFPGTDRFAMNVQPEAMAFLEELRDITDREITVLFEGDRLFNGKMLDWLHKENFQRVLCIVEADQTVVIQRRQARSNQNEAWRKGRQTKVDRISMSYPVDHWLPNTTKEEQDKSVQELIQEIKGTWKRTVPGSQLKDFWK